MNWRLSQAEGLGFPDRAIDLFAGVLRGEGVAGGERAEGDQGEPRRSDCPGVASEEVVRSRVDRQHDHPEGDEEGDRAELEDLRPAVQQAGQGDGDRRDQPDDDGRPGRVASGG